jgi:tetratricopeptide (TPR) repeat protein
LLLFLQKKKNLPLLKKSPISARRAGIVRNDYVTPSRQHGVMTPLVAADLDAARQAEAQFNRANALRRLGHVAEALDGYDRAIALQPRWAAPHLNRGALLADGGNPRAAIQSFRRVTEIDPGHAQGWCNLGNALSVLGRHQDAIAALRRATEAAPGDAIAQYNLGNALTAAGRKIEAAQTYTHALSLAPHFAPAAVNLASRLRELGEADAALNAAGLAVQAAPRLAPGWIALGCAQIDLGAFDAAEGALREACAIDPASPVAFANLGLVLAAKGCFADALDSYDAALALAPDDAQAAFGRATTLLAMGDYARGWPAFLCRHRMPDAERRGFTQPAWRGEAARGQTLLLHAEQGFGDTLQFLRFVPLAAASAGARIVLEVQPPLKRLCATLAGAHAVIARGEDLPRFDRHCALLDLAALFAPSLQALAPAAPYLSALPGDPPWQAPCDAQRPLVGLVWAGQSRPDQPHAFAMDRRRSMRLADFAPLAGLGLTLVSLQMGKPAEERHTPPAGLQIENAMESVTDFADTAAIIAGLDLVISVDTSTAHLAAAMGKPVWLLTRSDACWRWLRGRDDSPWYATLRLFRQPVPGDWRSVVAAVAEALQAAAR